MNRVINGILNLLLIPVMGDINHGCIIQMLKCCAGVKSIEAGVQNNKTGVPNIEAGVQNNKTGVPNIKTGVQNNKAGVSNPNSPTYLYPLFQTGNQHLRK